MLLSAICISICYTAYGLIGKYYQEFQLKNERADSILSLKKVLETDFLKSKYVFRHENGLELQQDSLTIHYQFREQDVLRLYADLHTDTFKLATGQTEFSFEQQIVSERDTIDKVKLYVFADQSTAIPLEVYKFYSAADLLN